MREGNGNYTVEKLFLQSHFKVQVAEVAKLVDALL